MIIRVRKKVQERNQRKQTIKETRNNKKNQTNRKRKKNYNDDVIGEKERKRKFFKSWISGLLET